MYLPGKDGQLPPKVTKVVPYDKPETTGLVRAFELYGDEAADLLDYLLEYGAVDFAVRSDCPESSDYRPGWSTFNFQARGLERALKRL